MALRLILFALFSITLQGLIHYYLWRRLVRDTRLPHPWRRLATYSIIALGASIPATIWSARLVSPVIGKTVGWPVFLWMALAGLLLVGFLLVDTARLITRPVRAAARKRTRRREPPDEEPDDIDLDRRTFMARAAGGSLLAAAGTAVGTGVHQVLAEHRIVEVPVVLPRLPRALDGFTIVQLTDIHVGYTVSRSFVEDIVARAHDAGPDLIAITGDLVDGDVPGLGHRVAPLGELTAPHGVYFVTGNHEYYAGVDPWLDELTRLGIRVLRNERVAIDRAGQGFDLAGIDDHEAERFGNGHGADLERALAGRDPSREVVLLAHQPRQVRTAMKHGVGLQLSGHTHGGQIWPWHYIARAQQGGLLAGLSRHDATQLYVSRGAGYWGPPVRVGAPSEITKIVLRSGREA